MKKKEHNLNLKQQTKIIHELFESSKLNWDFYLMLILSSVIVTLGLLMNNTAVVIGGMLVAPLLSPLLVFSLGIVVSDGSVIWRAAKVVLSSLGLVVVISFVLSLITPSKIIDTEIISRSYINITFFYIALASGVAAAFAWIRPNLSITLPGIAISVALLPPIATIGIGISVWGQSLTFGALQLFIGNLLGIVIAAALVFSVLGFSRVKNIAKDKVRQEEKEKMIKDLEFEKNKEAEKKRLMKEVEKELNGK